MSWKHLGKHQVFLKFPVLICSKNPIRKNLSAFIIFWFYLLLPQIQLLAQAQTKNLKDRFIDAGYGLTTMYAGGVDPDKSGLADPDFSYGIHQLLYKKGQTKPFDTDGDNCCLRLGFK